MKQSRLLSYALALYLGLGAAGASAAPETTGANSSQTANAGDNSTIKSNTSEVKTTDANAANKNAQTAKSSDA